MNAESEEKFEEIEEVEDEEAEEKFLPLTNDYLFQSLWTEGSIESKKFLYRFISNIVGIDISKFEVKNNEIGIEAGKGKRNRLDILLESSDKKIKIDIELNTQYYKGLRNRNESYLYRIAGRYFKRGSKNKYKDKITVYQVNLDLFSLRDDKKIGISTYSMKDKENDLDLNSIKIIDIFIPTICKTWYNIDTEIQLDYKMFIAKNYEEMEKYAKDNKERRAIMEDIKEKMKTDELLERIYEEQKFYNEEVKVDIEKKALKKGVKKGIKKGREEERKEIINKLISSGMPKAEISKVLGIPVL